MLQDDEVEVWITALQVLHCYPPRCKHVLRLRKLEDKVVATFAVGSTLLQLIGGHADQVVLFHTGGAIVCRLLDEGAHHEDVEIRFVAGHQLVAQVGMDVALIGGAIGVEPGFGRFGEGVRAFGKPVAIPQRLEPCGTPVHAGHDDLGDGLDAGG